MGSPSEAISNIKNTFDESTQDISKGLDQIGQGQIERGIGNMAAGGGNLSMNYMGFGLPAALGVKLTGQTAIESAYDKARIAAKDSADFVAGSERQARLDKIQAMLKSSIELRQRQPGRSQTLLTSNLVPSGTNTKTLLTSASASTKA